MSSTARLLRRLGLRGLGVCATGAAAAYAYAACEPGKVGGEKYKIGKTLGEGGFATVKLATNVSTGQTHAAKFVHKAGTSEKHFGQEVSVLRVCGMHRHIVSLIGTFEEADAWVLVLELVTGGEVFDRICESGTYSERDAAAIVRQVCLALRHIHQRGVVHRDLKPENLLLVSAAKFRRQAVRLWPRTAHRRGHSASSRQNRHDLIHAARGTQGHSVW